MGFVTRFLKGSWMTKARQVAFQPKKMKELLVFTYICVSNRIAAIYGALNNASGFYNTQLIFY